MPESIYKVVEIIGSSSVSWEDAAKNIINRASRTLSDLRIAEVVNQDLKIKDGKIEAYRIKILLSFKYKD